MERVYRPPEFALGESAPTAAAPLASTHRRSWLSLSHAATRRSGTAVPPNAQVAPATQYRRAPCARGTPLPGPRLPNRLRRRVFESPVRPAPVLLVPAATPPIRSLGLDRPASG